MASFGIGYKLGSEGKAKTEKELRIEKIEKELLQNQITSRDYFDSHDPIKDALERRTLLNGSGRKSNGTDSDGM